MAKRELTFEQVRDGIILALNSAYPNTNVRSDRAPQSVNDGEFNVVLVTTRTPSHLMDAWLHSVTFDVVYYVDRSESAIDDMMRVATDLPLLLETITTPSGAKIHPVGSVEPTPMDDGTLHTVVRYDYHVIARRVRVDDQGHEISDTDLMRRLELHNIPKEDDKHGES